MTLLPLLHDPMINCRPEHSPPLLCAAHFIVAPPGEPFPSLTCLKDAPHCIYCLILLNLIVLLFASPVNLSIFFLHHPFQGWSNLGHTSFKLILLYFCMLGRDVSHHCGFPAIIVPFQSRGIIVFLLNVARGTLFSYLLFSVFSHGPFFLWTLPPGTDLLAVRFLLPPLKVSLQGFFRRNPPPFVLL